MISGNNLMKIGILYEIIDHSKKELNFDIFNLFRPKVFLQSFLSDLFVNFLHVRNIYQRCRNLILLCIVKPQMCKNYGGLFVCIQ